MANLRGQLLGVFRGDVQVLGGDLVGQRAGLVGIAGQDHRAELFQALPGQLAALQAGQLPRQARPPRRPAPVRSSRSARWPPGRVRPGRSGPSAVNSGRVDSSTITTTSLGPAIESMSTSPKTCRLARATNRLPGPTILSTRGMPFDAVGQRGHGLGAAQAIDLA